ncbi:peptide ABC transporter substrate-binding protein [Levilactobacillus bambusae]|uniref:Solute-binding protein family 5 domain-containing protein n=1 Tax=Levilactobacillus bambusae TaxID=2024736 RepID=A0A2V1N184_9LACO|nr:peptide ABC transporter substrate-binding protein [Levilactobacillus bambusae]PWG00136.1 hypothetical protein DCM90_04160 [Levilactobacillus bambusae]
MKHPHTGLLVLIACCLLLVGCTNHTPAVHKSNSQGVMSTHQVLNLSTTQPLSTINVSEATGFGRLTDLYEGLYRLDGDGHATNALAIKTRETENGKRIVFTLRPNLKWSNGDPLTASDFVYSWRQTINPANHSSYAFLFDILKNGSAVRSGRKSPDQLGVKAVDDRHLEVTLDHRVTYLKSLLAYPLFSPQDEAFAEKQGSQYATSASTQVYNGPFQLTKWTKTGWTATRNKTYWDRDNVYLTQVKTIVYRHPNEALAAYKRGDVDEVKLSGLVKHAETIHSTYNARPYSQTNYIGYNFHDQNTTANRILNNRNTRLAISHALNRQAIINEALGDSSLPSKGIVPAGLSYNTETGTDFADQQNEEPVTYNLKQAQREWQKAREQTHLSTITVNLLYRRDPTSQMVVQAVTQRLQKNLPGLKIKLVPMTVKPLTRALQQGKFDLYYLGWGADYADPSAMLQVFTSNNSYNYGQWENKTYNQEYQKISLETTFSYQDRWQLMLQANNRLMADQGVTPIFQPATSYLTNSRLKGLIKNTTGASTDYKGAYFIQ